MIICAQLRFTSLLLAVLAFLSIFTIKLQAEATDSEKLIPLSIVMPSQLESDDGYALALSDLEKALSANRFSVSIHYQKEHSPFPSGNKIIIKTKEQSDNSPLISPKEDAYKIIPVQNKSVKILQIQGNLRGGMYGIFKLAELINLGKYIWDISLEMEPDFSCRMYTELGQLYDLPSVGYHLFEAPWVNHKRFEAEKEELKRLIDQVARLGFNTFTILHVNFEDYINYKYLDKTVYGKDDVHRIKSVHFARHLTDIIEYAHKRHIEVFMQVYEFQYPPKLAELYKLDLGDPDMETIINAKVKELFEVVPSLDGLVITATESLPRSGYKSVEPWRKYGKAGAGKMMTMYHKAAKAMGKTLIFRSWMVAYGAKDSHKVLENTPPDARFEIKHTGDDFWLCFPLTDAITTGMGKKRPLMITFDVFPEYYGWSRLICYLQRCAEEAKIAKENGVVDIQAWAAWAPGCIWRDKHPGYLPNGQLKAKVKPIDRAGPWNTFRMYTRGFTPGQMNSYLVGRLGWDSNLTAEQVAADWATLCFGQQNSEAISTILMNSQAAFRELYMGKKREFKFHPTYLKWATTVSIRLKTLELMYMKIPLNTILERNQIGYNHLEKMKDAFARIDSTKVPSIEYYEKLKEGLEKTELYLRMFYEFREAWWRKRELKDTSDESEYTKKQSEYKIATDKLEATLKQWQKYPEEMKFWKISRKAFRGAFPDASTPAKPKQPSVEEAAKLKKRPGFHWIEAEDMEGSWILGRNYSGYYGKGFRVSKDPDQQNGTTLTQMLNVKIAGRYAIWSHGLVGPGQRNRQFAVTVKGKTFPPTHKDKAGISGIFLWQKAGEIDLSAGKTTITIQDAGSGYQSADVILLTKDLKWQPGK